MEQVFGALVKELGSRKEANRLFPRIYRRTKPAEEAADQADAA